MIRLVEYMADQDYQRADELSHQMSLRCSRSPMLNYIQAKLQEEKGDIDAAKLFYQKASEYTYEFAVAPDTAKKIWYARYEVENPEQTQGGVSKLRLMRDKNLEKAQELEDKYALIAEKTYADQIGEYKTLTWTGTGIGIAGIVLLSAGFGMAMTLDDDEKYYSVSQKPDNYAIKPGYSFSLAMIGAGGAMTIAGAVLAGIYGYKWANLDKNESVALGVSPNRVSLTWSF